MNLRFHRCTLADLEAVSKLSKSTFCTAFEAQNNPEDFKTYVEFAFDKKKLKQELLCVHSSFYFAYYNDILAGYFKTNESTAQTDLKIEEALEIERIYVTKDFQGKGLGHNMIQYIKQIAFAKEKRFLWLGVWEKNTKAIAFYQREGFIQFGTHPYSIGTDQQTDWLMRLDLLTLDKA
ncbi:GNAT family N-acetyltransferase [Arenibacter sp. GZD96]|uniref:GNAT family N-acetyltransferase n=1 Tax=Aurantibrevibacter litoralis TaxID=3106030 RepID=UPI002AFE4041|nr:GNAT family N-acetyltransferase [Arenibacter sp. GZD-96]MEA1786397.1 GNAT family N-acetyltransferase [Arenibacter sp. GZD-96]